VILQPTTTATLLAVSVLGVSCATTAPAPGSAPAQQSADLLLANRVSLALNADPVYFYRHVSVRVSGGVADLSGYVWSTDAIYRARQIARGVRGVSRVVTNHLELEREGRDHGITR
jgi:osmotically-inducible protein OsmY